MPSAARLSRCLPLRRRYAHLAPQRVGRSVLFACANRFGQWPHLDVIVAVFQYAAELDFKVVVPQAAARSATARALINDSLPIRAHLADIDDEHLAWEAEEIHKTSAHRKRLACDRGSRNLNIGPEVDRVEMPTTQHEAHCDERAQQCPQTELKPLFHSLGTLTASVDIAAATARRSVPATLAAIRPACPELNRSR